MTREEAVAIAVKAKDDWGRGSSESWLVGALNALGVLPLTEPKTLPQKLRDFVRDTRLVQGGEMERLDKLQAVLRDCGLKIVEADFKR